MSNKKQHRKRLLEHEFCIWFNLITDTDKRYKCCLAVDNLTTAEQENISMNMPDVGERLWRALEPYLEVIPNQPIDNRTDITYYTNDKKETKDNRTHDMG